MDAKLLAAAKKAIAKGIHLKSRGFDPITSANFSLPYAVKVTIGAAGVSGTTFVDNAEFREQVFQTHNAQVRGQRHNACTHCRAACKSPPRLSGTCMEHGQLAWVVACRLESCKSLECNDCNSNSQPCHGVCWHGASVATTSLSPLLFVRNIVSPEWNGMVIHAITNPVLRCSLRGGHNCK